MAEAESPPPKLFAKVELAGLGLGSERVVPVTATVCFERRDGQKWKWTVSLRSFEPIHGMSRVTKLVGDKLRTAMDLNSENLPDPKDDGTFFVDLVLDLCKFFRDQLEGSRELGRTALLARKKVAERPEPALEFSLGSYAPRNEEGGLSLEETLVMFTVRLERFKQLLVDRVGQERLRQANERILELSVDLLVCCLTYTSFVHGAWIEANRRNVSPELLEVFRADARLKVERSELAVRRDLLTNRLCICPQTVLFKT
jgi:hypothetical protein